MREKKESKPKGGAKSPKGPGAGTRQGGSGKSAARKKKASRGQKAASRKSGRKDERKPVKRARTVKNAPKERAGKRRGKRSGAECPAKTSSRPGRRSGSFPIAALGASAGGLEALKDFFGRMPAKTGAAFVVVTHQHPGHVSLLPELIARVAKLPVEEAKAGARIEPDRIYVAPPGALMNIEGGVLHLEATEDDHSPHLPIDHFFRSLAADQREHAVCVVLSGTGTDGTTGLRAVKAESGMVMVQSPESAKYASMPGSASSTGLADYVLPPAEMPDQLLAYVKGPYLKPRAPLVEEAVPFPREPVIQILSLIKRRTGHDFRQYKAGTIQRRLERRMNLHQIREPNRYLEYLRGNPREVDLLLSELLISVTSFFRDPKAFEVLAEKVLPELIRSLTDDRALRVWVVGCATGEEAYSVAILIQECMERMERQCTVQVFATDLDDQAIQVARTGRYPVGIEEHMSKTRLERYFNREESSYRIRKIIRDMIVFAPQNMIKDPPFTKLDLIACRNLLIYLDGALQRKVLELFHYSLRPQGLVFLGPSETLGKSADLFESVDNKWKIFRRKETKSPVRPIMDDPLEQRTPGEASPSMGEYGGETRSRTTKEIERMLLSRFTPASLVVDERGNIFYIHGRTGDFLEPSAGQQPRSNILEMARKGLQTVLASGIRQAAVKKEAIIRPRVRVQTNGRHSLVDVAVEPIEEPEEVRGMLLVTLQPSAVAAPHKKASSPVAGKGDGDASDLEQELRHTRESLQTTIEELQSTNEELKSSNEELQSTNEELQSTNEELETSKEELQSLNEELTTVNTELESKLSELASLRDDMQNLLNSTNVATIFLDSELRVKSYTERAKELVNLIQTDMGRPLRDLASNLEYDRLIEDCEEVLKDLVPREEEVVSREGRWYLMRAMPYRTAENVIDGVVLTFVEIDRLKKMEIKARAAADHFEHIVQTVREPLLVLDGKLQVLTANESFFRDFQARPEDIRGKRLYELGGGQWDIPELRELLEEILPLNSSFCDFRVEHDFPSVGRRAFLLNARRMTGRSDGPFMILLAFEDVTREVEP